MNDEIVCKLFMDFVAHLMLITVGNKNAEFLLSIVSFDTLYKNLSF